MRFGVNGLDARVAPVARYILDLEVSMGVAMFGFIFGALAVVAGMELVNSVASVPPDTRRERIALGAFLVCLGGLAAGVLSC